MSTTTSAPTPVTFSSEEPLANLLKRAYLMLEHGELELTRTCLASACARYPEQPMPHALEGAVEIAAGDLDSALKILRQVTRKWPEHPAGQLYLAEAFLLSRKLGQARRKVHAVQSILDKLDPSHPDRVWHEMASHLEALCEELEPESIPEPLRSLTGDAQPSGS